MVALTIFCIWDAIQTLVIILLIIYCFRLRSHVDELLSDIEAKNQSLKDYREDWQNEHQRRNLEHAALAALTDKVVHDCPTKSSCSVFKSIYF